VRRSALAHHPETGALVPCRYPEDVLVHATNAGVNPYYRTFKSLPDNLNFTGQCFRGAASGRDYECFPCVYDQYGFGWAIQVTTQGSDYQVVVHDW
jgi:hypothetical protein